MHSYLLAVLRVSWEVGAMYRIVSYMSLNEIETIKWQPDDSSCPRLVFGSIKACQSKITTTQDGDDGNGSRSYLMACNCQTGCRFHNGVPRR